MNPLTFCACFAVVTLNIRVENRNIYTLTQNETMSPKNL